MDIVESTAGPVVGTRPRRRRPGRLVATLLTTGLVLALSALVPAQAAPDRWDAPGWGYELTSWGTRYSSPLGTYDVSQAVDRTHRAHGGGTGALGYPVTSFTSQGNGYGHQVFERGVIYSSGRGTHAVTGALDARHRAGGGGTGALGYPTGGQVHQGGAYWYQTFERGVLYSSTAGTFATASSSHLTTMHRAAGGGSGRYGYPTAEEWNHLPGQWLQPFERGYAYVETNSSTTRSWCATNTCRVVPGTGSYWIDRPAEAAHVVAATNRERAANGLAAVREDPLQSAAAQRWAEKLLVTDTLGHHSEELGLQNRARSENVASGWRGVSYPAPSGWNPYPDPRVNADRVVQDWMDSAGHRRNLLGSHQRIGVGWITGFSTADPQWYRLMYRGVQQFS